MPIRRITILSARGGMGKTTVAAGIARAAARLCRVALVDLDFGTRAMDACLGCEDRVVYDLGDLLAERRDISGVVLRPEDNLFYIPGAYCPGTRPEPDRMTAVLDAIRRETDAQLLILDTSSVTDPLAEWAAGYADTALVVTTPAQRAILSAASLAEQLRQWEIAEPRLVINRLSLVPCATDLRRVIDTVALPLVGLIPEGEMMEQILLDSTAFSMNHSISTAFSNIAARLLGEAVPLLSEVTPHRRAVLAV